jgi:GYF domain 2
MPVRWYYLNQTGVVGPVSEAELKYLINGGTIGISALVRQGEDGQWLAAEKNEGLLGMAREVDTAGGCTRETPEWYFNLKGQNKQGPVPWAALMAMSADGELQPEDLVWKPGMALWAPACQVRGLMEESAPESDLRPSFQDRLGLRLRRPGAAVMVLLVLMAGVAGVKWVHTGSRDLADGGAKRAPRATEKIAANGGAGNTAVEQLLDDARSAVRVEQLERATRLLEQYLASPLAKRVDLAKLLLREIKLVTSAPEAARVAQNLGDESLKTYLRQGAEPLVGAIETPELRPIYDRTLLRALRQESNRRQMVPKVAIAQNPNLVEAGPIPQNQDPNPERAPAAEPQDPLDRPRLSIFGPAGPAGRGPGGQPDPKNGDPRLPRRPGPIPADLDFVLAKLGEFAGNTLVLNGLFKIGTKITEVKGPDGQVLGWSLPVARSDDSSVCSVEGKVGREKVYLLLDDRLAAFLEHVFNKLRLRPTINPSYKCILTVTTRRLLVNGSPTSVIAISSMEVLGGCDYLSVARHQYSRAFRTLTVTPDEADVDFGDGDLWVERLGGEENFVKPIRRKFRDVQRRAITNRDSAIIDSIIQRELIKVVNTASAINQIVAIEGLRRMRILP